MTAKSLLPLLFGLALVVVGALAQELGVDRPGSDLRPGFDLPAPDPVLCKQACDKDTNCKAYTYVRPGYQGRTARCWLKSAVPAAVKNNCCVSGVKTISHQAVLAPIQLPSPAGAKGSTVGGPFYGQARTTLAENKPMLRRPSPEDAAAVLKKGAAMGVIESRRTIIESVAANPITRSTLEKIATVEQTSIASLIATPLPLSKVLAAPPALLELWKLPIRISPVEPGPMYSIGDSSYAIGTMITNNIRIDTGWPYCGLSSINNRGLVCLNATFSPTLKNDKYLDAEDLIPIEIKTEVELPPGGGSYVIIVHVIERTTHPLGGLQMLTTLTASNYDSFVEAVPLVFKADRSALLGILTIPPDTPSAKHGAETMRNVSIVLFLSLNGEFEYVFSGITIMRL